VYPCRGEDRWIAIACWNDQQWDGLRWTANPEAGPLHDERFATFLGRKSHEDDLDRLIGEWTAVHEGRDLMGLLQAAGVPAGVVNDPRDLFDDPQLRHREHFQWLDHPEIGPYATDSSEMRLSLTPGGLETPAPLLGQHTEHVLRELIGLSEAEYRSLEEDGALE
jgi:benzylsuccinate CoA-transferase BbsF subunit